jgi:hypothetical protein
MLDVSVLRRTAAQRSAGTPSWSRGSTAFAGLSTRYEVPDLAPFIGISILGGIGMIFIDAPARGLPGRSVSL